ncbi:class I SAM-dependent methyltransferase [Stieleria sp. JC731]|uniref:class I SAM-dependent methyltransferase n=1 Tax=Pirellulaceae TaxID=2691357 RepID=UPI001E4E14E9|nr:class I SAM-dependent methyltransferase [Stieleria sp. JC731]MCC9603029.1 class I SAM-dependent methyltransferase [Stieleria sp. JC731]
MNTQPQIALDDLSLFGLREEPAISEQMIVNENRLAENNELADRILKSVYWEADRDAAFNRYYKSNDFANTLKLLKIFSVAPDRPLVEIGGGSGFLSWALNRRGFSNLTLMEPNPHFITGTGYLRSREDSQGIKIANSLEGFYESSTKFDTVVTRNCIHHFRNITYVASCIRQKMNTGGQWVVIREPYIESATELYQFLQGHPYSQPYGIYEFGFPASYYCDSIELAGFKLKSVVPAGYANSSLAQFSEERGRTLNRLGSKLTDTILKYAPSTTVKLFRTEQAIRDLLNIHKSLFSKPQVMVFERVELGELPENAIWYRPSALPDIDLKDQRTAA